MSKQWLVKNLEGKIQGPFSEEEICDKIAQLEFSGEEYITLHPSSSQWKNIASHPPFYDALFKVLSPTSEKKKTDTLTKIKLKKSGEKGSFEKVSLEIKKGTDSIPHDDSNSSEQDSSYTIKTKKRLRDRSGKPFQKVNIRKSGDDTSIIDLGRAQPFMFQALIRKLFFPFIVIFGAVFIFIYLSTGSKTNRILTQDIEVQLLSPRGQQAVTSKKENVENLKRGLSYYLTDQVLDHLKAQDTFIQVVEGDSKNMIAMAYLCLTYFELWPFTHQTSKDVQVITDMTKRVEKINRGGIYSALCQVVQHLIHDRLNVAESLVNTSMDEFAYNDYSENIVPFFYYLESVINFRHLKYDEALQNLDHVRTILPIMTRASIFAAQIAQEQSQYNQALKLYVDVLKNHPQHKTALFGKGILLHNYLGQYSEGEQVIRETLNVPGVVSPYYLAEAHFILAKSALKINDSNDFLKHAKQAYILDPSNTELQKLMKQHGNIQQELTRTPVKSRLLIEKGDQLARSGSLFEARSHYEQAFEVDKGKNAVAAIKMGEILWKSGLSLEAIDWLQKAIAADPQLIKPYIIMSNYYSYLYEMDKASQILKIANNRSPNNLEVFKGYAALNLKMHHVGRAVAYAKKALEIYESDVESYVILSQAYYLEGQYTQALEMARLGTELNNNNISAQIHYARALGKIHGVGMAFEYFQDLISNTQSSSQSHIEYTLGLSQFLYDNMEYANALNVLKTIENLKEKSITYYLLLGKVYSKMDASAQLAHEQFLQAALINPSDPVVMYELSQLLMTFRQYDEALSHLKKILELYPRYPKIRYFIARILARKGGKVNLNRALKELKLEIKVNPDEPDAYQLSGDIYDRLKKYTLCAQAFQKAIAILPHDSELYVRSAVCYRRTGALDLALQLLNRVAGDLNSNKEKSSNPKVYRELGAIYEVKRDYDSATKAYALYLDLLPNANDKKQIEARVKKFDN